MSDYKQALNRKRLSTADDMLVKVQSILRNDQLHYTDIHNAIRLLQGATSQLVSVSLYLNQTIEPKVGE